MIPENSRRTPVGNTGVNTSKTGIHAKIDWLQGTFPVSAIAKVRLVVGSAFKAEVCDRIGGTRFYEHSQSCGGALIAWQPRKGGKVEQRTDAYIEMSASCLNQLSHKRQFVLFKSLASLGFRASRVDLTLDDYDKRFRPADAYQVYRDGGVTGFRNTGSYKETHVKGGQFAQTFSCGKRGKMGGGKYLVIYDKWLESNGEIDAVRVEVSFYGQFAKQAFQSLLADSELWTQIIPCYVFGAVNFLDVVPGKEVRADRCKQVSWWASIVQDSPAIKMSRPIVVRSYEKAVKWFRKQVAPTLAMLLDVIALESPEAWWTFFWEVVEDGQKRWNDEQLVMMRDAELRMREG